MAQPERSQMAKTWRMRSACWLTKAIKTHSDYVIRTAFPLEKWLRQCASMLR